ncbi:MAG: SDR family oxidoreductase [Gemmatimonadales bacterium]|nr:MAG: SDR family oxidoreductase [Gemmatimonadales bacterium]
MSERPRALVTGGAVRVGRAIAVALADAGYDLMLHYHSSAVQAEEAAERVRSKGARVQTVQADLSDPAQIGLTFDAMDEAFGGLDLLVNNAAIFPRVDPLKATYTDWDTVFALNARAPFLCAQEAARRMGTRGGAIVNIVDTGATEAWPNYVPYVASKAALASVTKGLAAAYAPHIRVNGVAPGAVLLPEDDSDEGAREAASRSTVLGRMGAAEDVAAAVVYLARATYVTGEILRVDGGQHLKGRRTAG